MDKASQPRLYWPLSASQSLRWNWVALRLMLRDLAGMPADTGRSLDLYRTLVVLDR